MTGRTVVAADGLPLHVEEHDVDGATATIVLVHGYVLSTRCWHRQLDTLSKVFAPAGMRVVAYDHRGHGRSAATSSDRATIGQLADDLAAVLDQCAPEGPILLVGHSMGGMTLMALAEAQPHLFGARVQGVVLMSTSPGRLGEVTFGLPRVLARVVHQTIPVVNERRRAAARRGLDRVPTAVTRAVVRRVTFGMDPRAEDVDLVTELVATTPAGSTADFHVALGAHDRREALAVLRAVPTLVMVGDRDLLCPPGHSHDIADQLPGCELLTFPGAGHMLMLERSEEVNGRLAGFATRTLAARPSA